MGEVEGEESRERRRECETFEEESMWLMKFVQCQLTSSSVFQQLGGNCPSTRVPNLEIACKVLHVCVCFHRGLQICKSGTPRKVENHSKSHLQVPSC